MFYLILGLFFVLVFGYVFLMIAFWFNMLMTSFKKPDDAMKKYMEYQETKATLNNADDNMWRK